MGRMGLFPSGRIERFGSACMEPGYDIQGSDCTLVLLSGRGRSIFPAGAAVGGDRPAASTAVPTYWFESARIASRADIYGSDCTRALMAGRALPLLATVGAAGTSGALSPMDGTLSTTGSKDNVTLLTPRLAARQLL